MARGGRDRSHVPRVARVPVTLRPGRRPGRMRSMSTRMMARLMAVGGRGPVTLVLPGTDARPLALVVPGRGARPDAICAGIMRWALSFGRGAHPSEDDEQRYREPRPTSQDKPAKALRVISRP